MDLNCLFSTGRQLDAKLLLLISVCITDETQLRELAAQGLHLEDHVIDSAVNHEETISLAVHVLLKKWRDAHLNSREAFRKLYDIFERLKMSLIMNEALKACNK